MSERVRVGVVGLGLMGMRHAAVLAAHPGVHLLGGVDRDRAARTDFHRGFGAQVHARIDGLLGTKPDAVIVCLPDNAHRNAVCAALRAGSHVLVEKPLATRAEDAVTMQAEATRSGKSLMVGFALRFDPRYRAAIRAVRQGRVGDVRLVHARRNSARGATERYGSSTTLPWHVSVHDIDAVVAATGQRVREVTARACPPESGHWDALGALLTLERGAPLVLESAWNLPRTMRSAIDSRLEIVGTDGVVEVAGLDEGLRIVDEDGFDLPDVIRYHDDAGAGPGGALTYEIAHFLDLCRGNGDGETDLTRAVHVTEVIAALERSLTQHTTASVVTGPSSIISVDDVATPGT